ncbi:related to Probable beta-glucosidase M [Rhynchosporium graminicola]|uniref:beta-glucosidase n=1 Tax=Rhynchosporium graminicola TaxID=2792576 RepID=A0A1E1JVZ1_9HELO|nr:related to Probable beta-glucosidase M [Rhynchosporium commune]
MKFPSFSSTPVLSVLLLPLHLFSASAQHATVNITSDSYFYDQSPYVAPAALPSGSSESWTTAYAKAAEFVSQLSQEEKSNLTFGVRATKTRCVGFIAPIERLGFKVNAWSSGLHVGATWNKKLAYQRALHMGAEFKAKGVQIALGPVVGPIGRVAEGGRNWEGFSNDPYLCGVLAAETVRGIQENGVAASTKHFIGNEQELNRNPSTNSQRQKVESISSNIDDKTLHELYLWPFQDAVKAGTGNIMCSYNRVNNSYGCQNSKLQNGILKEELGFQGFVVTDWEALHGGYVAAEAGLDMVMPSGGVFWGSNLTAAINNGSMNASVLDNMATRIIATWYQFGQDSEDYPDPGVGIPRPLTAQHVFLDAATVPSSKQVLLNSAVEGHVLVKNTNGSLELPLQKPELVSVFGYDAVSPTKNPTQRPSNRNSQIINQTMIEDNSQLLWDITNVNSTAQVHSTSGACLVFINAWASEGYDRPGVHDDYSDALVNNIADQCHNTIVIIHNAGVRLVDVFIDHPNVTAVMFGHLPGQDSGRALVSLLYGEISSSGKLPYSVPKNESDYGALLSPTPPEGVYWLFPQDDFREGVYIDYRAFDEKNITPRYEFGFGLSYTTFEYSSLEIMKVDGSSTDEYPVGEIVEGGQEDLWDVLFHVTASVANSGTVNCAEVSQLYVGIPGGPVRQLRGFSKVDVAPGRSVDLKFDLQRRDLSVWDVVAQKWLLQKGDYKIYLGGSSRDLPLEGALNI